MDVDCDLDTDSVLKKGDLLYKNETLIATVLEDVPIKNFGHFDYGDACILQVYGYCFEGNIKPGTVVENFIEQRELHKDLTMENWTELLNTFHFRDEDEFLGYQAYSMYENSIDDPSPGFRILTFSQDNKMAGLIHSRYMKIPGADLRTMDAEYYVSFFNHVSSGAKSKFISDFNEWVGTVD